MKLVLIDEISALCGSDAPADQGRARRAGMPVIYVNDNFGHWRSNFAEVFKHATRKGRGGGR